MSDISEYGDLIRRHGEERRAQEAQDEADMIAKLPEALAGLADTPTSDLLLLWAQSRDRSHGWMTRKRTKAVYRLHAAHCRREILRRAGDRGPKE